MTLLTSRHISHDPINNLKIKIKLKRVTSTSVFGSVAETFANPSSTGQVIKFKMFLKFCSFAKLLSYVYTCSFAKLLSHVYISDLPTQDIELVARQEEAGATEEAVVGWQEKLLSQREVELYGDALNCNTVRDRKYHAIIERIREQVGLS